MKRFCRDNPAERLGYQKDGIADIKKHKWFQVGYSFDSLIGTIGVGELLLEGGR